MPEELLLQKIKMRNLRDPQISHLFAFCTFLPSPSLTHPFHQTYLELNDLPLQSRIHLFKTGVP